MQDQRHLDNNANPVNQWISYMPSTMCVCVYSEYSMCSRVGFDYSMQLTSNQHCRITHPTGDGRR